jgi:putative redox protein
LPSSSGLALDATHIETGIPQKRIEKEQAISERSYVCSISPSFIYPFCGIRFLTTPERSLKAKVKWIQDVMFVGESGSGHSVIMDGAPDAGGRNLGFRPMEMLLLGLAGCSAFDVVLILKRGRENVTDCVVEVDADRAETDPKVFTNVRMRYVVTGKGLDTNKVERAVKLSEEKYCSASAIIAKTAQMSHTVEIRELET